MNKIILDSPECTIVSTNNKVYIIGNDGNSHSIIPKGLIDEMAKNLGLYDKYNTAIKELNDKIKESNHIISEKNHIIRILKHDRKEDYNSNIREKIFGEDIVLVESTGKCYELCSKCSIAQECTLYNSNKYEGFDKLAISLIMTCVSNPNKYYIKYAKEITDETISKKKES